MTALIIGGYGEISVAIQAALLKFGHSLVIWSRSSGVDVRSPEFSASPKPDFDLDAVVHVAEAGPEGLLNVWSKTQIALEKSFGVFVFISSTEAVIGSTDYAQSKRKQESFLPTMAKSSRCVRVNCIRLGHVIGTSAWPSGSPLRPEQFLNAYVSPQDVADAVVFVLRQPAMTGQVLTLDSGILLNENLHR